MIFGTDSEIDHSEAVEIPLRLLAYLGDAVFELYERASEVKESSSARVLHSRVVSRVNASSQSSLLGRIKDSLNSKELDLVRRARNLKAPGSRKSGQSEYRRATAFEALIGYLFLTDRVRLEEILKLAADSE